MYVDNVNFFSLFIGQDYMFIYGTTLIFTVLNSFESMKKLLNVFLAC